VETNRVSAAAGTRPGRPRSRSADQAILDAAVELLCERGFEKTTIEAVAERSGISRPTIYRRHRNREALVEAAVRRAFMEGVPAPRSGGSPRADVLAHLMNTVHMLTRTPVGPLFRAAIPHLEHVPALGSLANELGRTRRRRLRAVLIEAIEAGEIRFAGEVDALLDGLLGAIYFRYLITGRGIQRSYVETLLAELTGDHRAHTGRELRERG